MIWSFIAYTLSERWQSYKEYQIWFHWVTDEWTWLYVASQNIWIIVLLYLLCVPQYRNLKLGLEDDEPEFSRLQWFSMLCCSARELTSPRAPEHAARPRGGRGKSVDGSRHRRGVPRGYSAGRGTAAGCHVDIPRGRIDVAAAAGPKNYGGAATMGLVETTPRLRRGSSAGHTIAGQGRLGPRSVRVNSGSRPPRFCCGVAVGLWFFGVAEPLWHFHGWGDPRWTDDAWNQNERANHALMVTYFQWGLHGWVPYEGRAEILPVQSRF